MSLTDEQRVKLFKFWKGIDIKVDDYFPDENLESLDTLMRIVEETVIPLLGETISIDFRHFEKVKLLYPKEKQWQCTFAPWFNGFIPGYDPNKRGFVLQYGGFGDTPIEALQSVLLKIAEEKDGLN